MLQCTPSIDVINAWHTLQHSAHYMTTDLTKSTEDVVLKLSYSVDPLPTYLDYLKTKDESDRNTFHVATSEFMKVGQTSHSKIAN